MYQPSDWPYLEKNLDKTLVLDEASSAGLFNLIASLKQDEIPIPCIDEAFTFFSTIANNSKIV